MLVPEYPMVVEATAAVFRKDKIPAWNGIKSLENRRAVWLRGYDFHKSRHLKDVTFRKWEEIDEYDTAWHLLEKNRTDVYLDALIDIQRYIRKYKIDMSPYRVETVGEDKGYMVFSISEKSKKLIKIYDKNIKELFKSGELRRLFERWDYPFPTAEVWK
jgi:polar amino acid transport system substrate-binding protein